MFFFFFLFIKKFTNCLKTRCDIYCIFYWIIICYYKEKQWEKKLKPPKRRSTTKLNQLDFMSRELSLDTKEIERLPTVIKLLSASWTATTRPVPNGTSARESPTFTRSKTLLTTPDTDAAGVRLSTPTDMLVPWESSSPITSLPELWEPPSESWCTQTRPSEDQQLAEQVKVVRKSPFLKTSSNLVLSYPSSNLESWSPPNMNAM